MLVKYGREYMRPGIYRITCNVTDTHYIGQAKNLSNRVASHRQTLRKGTHKNKHLQNAYNKYGESNFSVAYVLYCEVGDMTWYEQRVLDIFRRNKNTYNTLAPVETPMLGRKREYNENCIQALHDNRDKAQSVLATMRLTDPSYIEHMRQVGRTAMSRLRSNPLIERKRKRKAAEAQRDPELRKLRSKQMKDRYEKGWKPKKTVVNKVGIVDLENGIYYESYTSAASANDVGVPTIHRWVNGRQDGRPNNKGKKHWCKYDETDIRHTQCRKA